MILSSSIDGSLWVVGDLFDNNDYKNKRYLASIYNKIKSILGRSYLPKSITPEPELSFAIVICMFYDFLIALFIMIFNYSLYFIADLMRFAQHEDITILLKLSFIVFMLIYAAHCLNLIIFIIRKCFEIGLWMFIIKMVH